MLFFNQRNRIDRRHEFNKRTIIICAFISLLAIYFIHHSSLYRYNANTKNTKTSLTISLKPASSNTSPIFCYDMPGTADIPSSKSLSSSNKTIYFIETSCKGGLDTRQACSVESAARASPGWQVTVLLAGPLTASFVDSKSYLRLSSMSNIKFIRLNVTDFSKGTPVEALISKHVLSASLYPLEHASDILRMLTLYTFGGVYMDLDVLVAKSFDSLPKNFAAKESADAMSNSIMAMTTDGVGRRFTEMALRDLSASYNPQLWSWNGPALALRTLTKICNTTDIKQMTVHTCHGINIFDSKYFHPIPYPAWRKYYSAHEAGPALAPHTYTYHVWNKLGHNTTISNTSLYSRLAAKYCPSVYESYEDEFRFVG